MMNQKIDTTEKLSSAEKEALLYSLEEEKMAHEVYSFLDEKWGSMQFNHIKNAEKRHFEAGKNILDAYAVLYDLKAEGKFTNPTIQKLYDELIAQGSKSEKDAFLAGALIEDFDIYDLRKEIKIAQNKNVLATLKHLEQGSQNHMRAFTRGLKAYNSSYTPQYISAAAYDEIISTPQGGGKNAEGCGMQQGNKRGKQNANMSKKGIGKGNVQKGMRCGNCPMQNQKTN